jgi:hypothetical protein
MRDVTLMVPSSCVDLDTQLESLGSPPHLIITIWDYVLMRFRILRNDVLRS